MVRIRIRNLLIVITVVLWLYPACAISTEWSPPETTTDWMKFTSGMATCIAVHELSHVLVALESGYTIHHDGLSITYSPEIRSRANHLRIASAGLQGQWIASEAAFAAGGKEGNFTSGIISGHLAITLAYIVVLRNHPEGDTVGIASASGLNVNQVVSLAVLPAILDAWRLFGNEVPRWVPVLSLALKGAEVSWVWTF